jgi:cell division protein FtsB
MKISLSLIILSIMAMLAITACGVPAEVQQQLTSLKNEVDQLNSEKTKLNADNKDLENKIAELEKELSSIERPLKDPSYSEARAFVLQDTSDKDFPNSYQLAVIQLIENARQKGIRAYYIIVTVKGTETWGLIGMNFIGFNTTDRGWIYFCTSGTCPDQEIKIEIGKKLSDINSWSGLQYDDTALSIHHIP